MPPRYQWNAVARSTHPPIVFVHGVRSTMATWTNPGGAAYEYTFDYAHKPPDGDAGWKYAPPVVPVRGMAKSRKLHPMSFYNYLSSFIPSRGGPTFSVLAFDQTRPDDFVEYAVEDLRWVIDFLLSRVVNANTGRPHTKVILIAHSRGGLVCRRYIQKYCHVNNKVEKVITLATPHSGSNLANVKRTVGGALSRVTGGKIKLPDILTPSPADAELEVNSSFIRTLNSDAPIPGISYYLAAGKNTTMFKVYSQTYTSSSYLPRVHVPPFHWEYTHTELFDAVGSLSILGGRLPELKPGEGDVLVAKSSALGRIDPNNPASPRIRTLSRPLGVLVVVRNHGDIVASSRVMHWAYRAIVGTPIISPPLLIARAL